MTARTLLPFDPTLVAPWTLGGGSHGALLLHGFGGTPPELRRLGVHLAEHGWRCSAPMLAGHGSTPETLARTRWQDWESSARSALDTLASGCDVVVVAGQSMGGTLALHLAATDSRIMAVAGLASPIWIRGLALRLLPIAKHVVRWNRPGADIDLWLPEAVEELYSYGRRSTHSIHELVRLMTVTRAELATVRQPVLLLHGARDRGIDPRNAADIEARLLCSAHVERVILERSGHAISVDIDRDTVNARVLAFFERYGR